MTPPIVCAIEKTTAEAVIGTGGELARELGLPLVFAHIGQVPARNSPDRQQRARGWTTHQGEEVLRQAHEFLPDGVEATERVQLGSAVKELSAIADELNAAFIVVGSRRRAPLLAALRGNVARTVAREASCPVVIVPNARPSKHRRSRQGERRTRSTVIAGVGGTERSGAATLVAKQLADRLGDRLLLVHAHEAPGPIAIHPGGSGDSDVPVPAVIWEALGHAGDRASFVIEDMPPAYALQAAAARENARLIVIGPDRSARSSLLPGSMVVQLQRLAPCPVVIVPEQDRAAFGEATLTEARRVA
jgi:nucleotide-binding universal stress UspA family protein